MADNLTPSWPPMPPPVKNFNPSYLSQFWFFFGFEGWKWKQRCVALCWIKNQGICIKTDKGMIKNVFQLQSLISFSILDCFQIWSLKMKSGVCGFMLNQKMRHLHQKWRSCGQKCFSNLISHIFFNFGLFSYLRVANESRGVWIYAKSKIKAFESKLTNLWSKTFLNFNLSIFFNFQFLIISSFAGNFDFFTCLRG